MWTFVTGTYSEFAEKNDRLHSVVRMTHRWHIFDAGLLCYVTKCAKTTLNFVVKHLNLFLVAEVRLVSLRRSAERSPSVRRQLRDWTRRAIRTGKERFTSSWAGLFLWFDMGAISVLCVSQLPANTRATPGSWNNGARLGLLARLLHWHRWCIWAWLSSVLG